MYATQDLDEAAHLIAKGHSLRRIEPAESSDQLVTFTFPDSESLRETVAAWQDRYTKPVPVDAARFADARRDLYRQVREVKNRG